LTVLSLPLGKEDAVIKKFIVKISPHLYKHYSLIMVILLAVAFTAVNVYAADDIWAVAKSLIKDIYAGIVGISTVLAGLMSAIAVIGAKMSNNQHKVDQAWDWLKRIWIAWAIINGIGAFIAFVTPLFSSYATLEP